MKDQPTTLDVSEAGQQEHEDWRAHSQAGRAKYVKVIRYHKQPHHNLLFYPLGKFRPRFMSQAELKAKQDRLAAEAEQKQLQAQPA